tara:strand:+ start:86 stop:595 length:510 start_codon:yes stop_codon:yes gene_type:complete
MKKNNIYLIGMMGSGKSTVGPILSKKMNIDYMDMDNELEKLMDMSLPMIFSDYGEERFRMIESAFFREISKVGQFIYATGGGIILADLNKSIIKETGIAVFLDCSIDMLIERIKNDKKERPLIADNMKKKMTAIYNERYELYKECSNHTIDTTKMNTDKVIQEIMQCIN